MIKSKRSITILIICLLFLNVCSVYGAAEDDMEPFIPAFISFLIPGGGQLINDQPEKALLHFGVFGGIWAVSSISFYSYWRVAGLASLAWSGYSAYDAYKVAEERGGRNLFSSSLSGYEKEEVLSTVNISGYEKERGDLSLAKVN